MSSTKSLEKKGFILIAMHRGEGSDPEISWLAASKKWPCPVFRDGNIKDFTLGANPQVFVFDDKGKVAFSTGASGDINKIVAAKTNEAQDWLLGGLTFAKMAAQAKDVAARKNLGKILAEALEKAKSADEAEKTEAGQISERLKKYADVLEARANRWIEDGRPAEAQEIRKTLADQFKDSEIGKEAAEEIAKNKEDAAFKNELEAEKAWKGIEPALAKLIPPKKGDDLEKWKTKSAAALKPILDKLNTLKTKCGETKAFQSYKKRAAWIGFE